MESLSDPVTFENSGSGILLGLAGGQNDFAERIALNELDNMDAVNRLFQGLAQLGQPVDRLPVYFFQHEVSQVLIADVICVGQHLREDDQGGTLFVGRLVVVIIEPEGSAASPVRPPTLQIRIRQRLKNQSANDHVLGLLVVGRKRNERVGVFEL